MDPLLSQSSNLGPTEDLMEQYLHLASDSWALYHSDCPHPTALYFCHRFTAQEKHCVTNTILSFKNLALQMTSSREWMRFSRVWMRSSRVWMRSSRVWMRSSRLWMTPSRVWVRSVRIVDEIQPSVYEIQPSVEEIEPGGQSV